MSEAERAFWARYANALVFRGIVGRSGEWHLRRAQRFVYGLEGKKLREVEAGFVDDYVAELGRDPKLEDWQVAQVVSALRVLFVDVVSAEWARGYDWQGRMDACRELGAEHPTVAREAPVADAAGSVDGKRRAAALSEEAVGAIGRLRELTRVRNMSIRTEQTYGEWAMRYARHNGGAIPADPGRVKAYLEYLALERRVSPSTQTQALNALVFLYREVLRAPLGDLGGYKRPSTRRKLPVVLTRAEVQALLGEMSGRFGLMAKLLWGTGMRLMECVRLRVKDVDFGNGYIVVHGGKGGKHRRVPLPQIYAAELKAHLAQVRLQYQTDRAAGYGEVYVPDSLRRKYPSVAHEWGWHYVFPAARISTDPRSGRRMRHHINENGLQKAVKAAASRAGIVKQVNCHCLRHSFATHLLEANYDIRTVQELLGHADVSTTMVYTHVMNRPGVAARSPADLFGEASG
ncbi:MAG: integron integrase [Kiritimatiellae bacterium]|nr:integron integrase [Kiritimatiellia bacterium]